MAEAAVRLITVTPDELKRLVREAVREELDGVTVLEEQKGYATGKAAEVLGMSTNALLHHVRAGNITPDVWGKRGRTAGHRFTLETLQAFMGKQHGRKR